MTDAELEHRLSRMLDACAGRPVDTAEAWRQFTRLRARSVRDRGRRLIALTSVAVAIALIASLPAITHRLAGLTAPGAESLSARAAGGPAVTARVRLTGAGRVVAARAGQVWVFKSPDKLLRIDTAANRITYRERIPGAVGIAAGTGAIWALTTTGTAAAPYGQLVKVNPDTGRLVTTFPLYRRCGGGEVAAAGASLWLACGQASTEFIRIDPVSGHELASAGDVSGVTGIAATDDGIWYASSSGLGGYVTRGARGTRLAWRTARDARHQVSLAHARSLVFTGSALWAFTASQNSVEINPATGEVMRRYTETGYGYMTAGQGSLWFLSDSRGRPASVLKVSAATGQPEGTVANAGSCGQPCTQIYYALGSAWVPVTAQLTRIS